MRNDYQPNATGSTLTTIRNAFYQDAIHRICLQILTSLYKTKKREQASEIAHTHTKKNVFWLSVYFVQKQQNGGYRKTQLCLERRHYFMD